MKKINESYIENKVCDYAKSKGWLHYKFTSPSNIGVPDRIFMRLDTGVSVCFFIEFKAPGKKPTRLQSKVASLIMEQGFQVYVIDDVEVGKRLIDTFDKK